MTRRLPLVLSALALFVALGGPAVAEDAWVAAKKLLAKNSVTSKHVKNGSLRAKDFRASDLAALRGEQGIQGPKGDQGPEGDRGPTGPAGADGTATLPSSLPSGSTLTGVFSVTGEKETNDDYLAMDTMSFPFPVTTPYDIEVHQAGDPATTACPGTVQLPEAEPGTLCVYVNVVDNITAVSVSGFSEAGFEVGPTVPSLGFYYVNGSWAITAS